MGNNKEMNIKNRTYYFFDDMINIKNIDINLLKIDKKNKKVENCPNNLIYYTTSRLIAIIISFCNNYISFLIKG